CKWLISVDKRIPVHFSRFHPDFKMLDKPMTPVKKIEEAIEVAKREGVEYVYAGNVWGHKNENTYCPNCNELLIERYGFYVKRINLNGERCPSCGYRQNIVL
ncbi:MAG: AmmeMemoRadiSam system radical SAM enzyme, partial [Archaeoglobaceae archaeon]